MEDNTHTTAKNSFALVMEGGSGSIVGPGKTGEKDQRSIERTSAVRSEKKQSEKTLRDGDFPTRVDKLMRAIQWHVLNLLPFYPCPHTTQA